MVYAAGSEPPCLNVLIPACSSVTAGWAVPGLVLKGAFSFAPGNTLRAQLVSNVEFTRTPPFTLTYHIRPEAHWSDGVQISAQDFVFTHRAILKYVPPDADSDLAIDVTQVRSVRALGPKTVRVVLRTRFAGWRSLFSVVLPRHALAGEDFDDRLDRPDRQSEDGPADRKRALPRRALGAREAAHPGPERALLGPASRLPRPARAPIRCCSAEDLRNGKADILWAPVGRQEDFPRLPGFRRGFRPGLAFHHVEIRVGPGGHPALEDQARPPRTRLRHRPRGHRPGALRRDRPEAAALGQQRLPDPKPFYRPNWSSYRYRPREARRLLEQAGCRLGADGIYVCAGERLSLRIVFTTAGNPARELIVATRPEAAPAGGCRGRTHLCAVRRTLRTSGILASGDWDLALFGYAYGPDPDGLRRHLWLRRLGQRRPATASGS